MIEIDVTEEELNDILITAVEGGINYWAFVADYRPNNGMVSVAEDDKLRQPQEDEGRPRGLSAEVPACVSSVARRSQW